MRRVYDITEMKTSEVGSTIELKQRINIKHQWFYIKKARRGYLVLPTVPSDGYTLGK